MQAERDGYFGEFGGRFVPEVLIDPLEKLESAMRDAFADPEFWQTYRAMLRDFVGRPTPLYEAERFAIDTGTTFVCKREDLNHTGAHKINNTVGQGLLARRMRKRRIIAETGAGQHGVAAATIGAHLGIPVDVYMGALDMRRQPRNVALMRLLGARLLKVASGSQTLKDATNEALRQWAHDPDESYYLIGSVVGPHPYPILVREFQKVMGVEARAQCLERYGRLPSDVIACVGGGSNAIGIFSQFLGDPGVRLWGVEAAGHGTQSHNTAATLARGSIGVLHGSRSYVLQTLDGQINRTHSISAGLDYPGVGPEHAHLRFSGQATYVSVTDEQALDSCRSFARTEGILPALESAHALAFAKQLAIERRAGLLLVNLSGRGDKDMEIIGQPC